MSKSRAGYRRWYVRWGLFVGGAYVGGLVMLLLLETTLIYPAPRYPEGNWQPAFAYEDVHFTSADGTRLHGWLITQERPEHWILFMHGNGVHVAYAASGLAEVSRLLNANIFVFDYRGYGRSEGRPLEDGVLADGQAALDWLCQRSGLSSASIVVHGRSLGGAVAVHLAAVQPVKSMVLERTFTRLTDVAAYHYPWVPVRWLMRNRYPSIDKIQQCRAPLLISHGTNDRVVPYSNGESLYGAAGSTRKQLVPLDGWGHNDPNPEAYWSELGAFLQQ